MLERSEFEPRIADLRSRVAQLEEQQRAARGIAEVAIDERAVLVRENEVVYLPIGSMHHLWPTPARSRWS